jgi:HEAT repeat protein/type 1 glutamine amidotransferase
MIHPVRVTVTLAMLSLAAVLAAPAVGRAAAGEVAPALSPDQAFEQLKKWDYDQPRQPLNTLEIYIFRSTADPKAAHEIAERLAAVLANPQATDAAKLFACQQLRWVGTGVQVLLVAMMLDDPKTADMARRTLECIPGDASVAAIRSSLPRMKGDLLVGVINSLGNRRDAASTAALAASLGDADPKVAAAAAQALGKIGTAEAVASLLKAQGSADAKVAPAICDALLVAAQPLLAAGDSKTAETIYRAVLDSKPPAPLRVAVLAGLAKANKAAALPLVLEALAAEDAQLQAGAVRLTRDLPGADVTAALVQQLDKLAPAGQAMVIAVLAERGDKTAAAAVAKRLEDKDEAVRAAAARAMARLGDAACVDRLARMAASEKGDVQLAARMSLARMAGAEVDQRILAAAAQGEPAICAELLDAVAARRTPGAGPMLLKAASDADEHVRDSALDALAVVGGAEEYPRLVQLLVDAKGKSESAEKAVIAVGGRLPAQADRTKPVVALLGAAPAESKPSLLRVLASFGGPEALAAVRPYVSDAAAALRNAAVRALANWPDEAAADDLLAIVKNTDQATHRALALRGYLRLAGAAKDEPTRLKLLAAVRPIATTADSRRMVLAGLAEVADPAALEMAAAFVCDAEVRAEAALAVQRIAKALAPTRRADVAAAVARLKASPDKAVADRVEALIDEALAKRAPAGYRLACYLDCGPDTVDGTRGGPVVRVVGATKYQWPGAEQAAPARFSTVAYDARQVTFEASGLDPRRSYQAGFSWWDYDHNDRVQSVWAADGKGGRETKLLEKTKLPSGAMKQAPQEKTVAVPREMYADGTMRIMFRREGGQNVVVCEFWLWESEAQGAAPPASEKAPAAPVAEKTAAPLANPGPQEAPPSALEPKFTRAKPEPGRTTRILLVTGEEHGAHNWRQTAPLLAKELSKDPRLLVDVSEDVAILGSSRLADYAAVVLNYMNPKPVDFGPKARENLRTYVEGGRGLMLVHFACGAFQEWPEFRDLVGRVWDPKLRGHDPRGVFRVEFGLVKSPITEGLQPFDADDELYTCLTGDRPIVTLATAKSKVDGKDYPMAFTYTPGKGRVFQCLLGHDVKAMQVPGVGELYRRGCAWAAGLAPVVKP